MYCNAVVVLEIDSIYKQGKIIFFRHMLKSVNTPMQKKKQFSMLSDDDDDDGFFKV